MKEFKYPSARVNDEHKERLLLQVKLSIFIFSLNVFMVVGKLQKSFIKKEKKYPGKL